MKIGYEINHDKCLSILRDAGVLPPRIPKGKNTVWKHFKTADGLPAVVVNQGGFAPTVEDNEEQVNGLTIGVALVEQGADWNNCMATLEKHVIELLELSEPPSLPQGRPAGENDAVIRLRLPLAEKGEWVRKARKAGMSLSEWIRSKCES